MKLDKHLVTAIIDGVESLPLWSTHKERAAVVLTGSLAAGLADDHSDVDVSVLVWEPAFTALYEPLWQAVDQGAIRVLNPRARLFDEYPITYLPGVDGHYQIKSAEVVETRIRDMDHVVRWIYSNSVAISDESGLHARLRKLAASYPDDVLTDVRNRELYAAKNYFYSLKSQLRRDHRPSILLLCAQSISHLLKYFCLCDDGPFPYEKWLYQVGIATTLGRRAQRYMDGIMDELGRPAVVREKPDSYVEPGTRDEAFEDYRLYHLFLLLFREINAFRLEKYPGEVK